MSRATLLLALAFVAGPARAAIFCVDDAPAFQAALDAAAQSASDDEIRLLAGSYAAEGFTYLPPAYRGSLAITGGWNPLVPQCQAQLPDASLTRVEVSDTLSIHAAGASTAVRVANLTLQALGSGLGLHGLAVYSTDPALAHSLVLANVRSEFCQAAGFCGIHVSGNFATQVRSTVITSHFGERGAGLWLANAPQGSLTLNHVTVENNHSGATFYPGIYTDSPALVVANSILVNNHSAGAGTDCDLVGANFVPVHVLAAIVDESCSAFTPQSVVASGDPAFRFAPFDYRLLPDSIARDAGLANPPGGLSPVDLNGYARPLGAAPDLGAHEYRNSPPSLNGDLLTINEFWPAGTAIGPVTVSDVDFGASVDPTINQAIAFRIAAGNDDGVFAIDAATGVLRLAKAVDFEARSSYELQVGAHDGLEESIGNVTVEVQDYGGPADLNSPPVLEASDLLVQENHPAGTAILHSAICATDAEGQPVSFTLVGGNTGNAFSLTQHNSCFSLRVEAALDFEAITAYDLVIAASDGFLSSQGSVRVQLENVLEAGNDGPDFRTYRATVLAPLPAGPVVSRFIPLKLSPTDSDGDTVTYTVVSPGDGRFTVSPTGVISATAPVTTAGTSVVVVSASDGINAAVVDEVRITVQEEGIFAGGFEDD